MRQYNDTEQAEALAVLTACNGSARIASEKTGVPAQTLRQWRDGTRRPLTPAGDSLRAENTARLGDRFERVVNDMLDILDGNLEGIKPAQAAVIAGIATEKMLLCRGQATSIVQHQDDARLTALEAQYGALRAVIPITDATTAPEQPTISPTMPQEAPNATPDGQPPY